MRHDIYRIVDANLNRSREGLRVCEEITRFILDSSSLTKELKDLRHAVAKIVSQSQATQRKSMKARNSRSDVGRSDIVMREMDRFDVRDVFMANIQRVKESLRVLEEFFKILDKGNSVKFCALRFKIYEIEKKAFKKIEALRNIR